MWVLILFSLLVMSILFVIGCAEGLVPNCDSTCPHLFHLAFSLQVAVKDLSARVHIHLLISCIDAVINLSVSVEESELRILSLYHLPDIYYVLNFSIESELTKP